MHSGADILAVWYRASRLGLLLTVVTELPSWLLDDAKAKASYICDVFSRFPMRFSMGLSNELPFYLPTLLAELKRARVSSS